MKRYIGLTLLILILISGPVFAEEAVTNPLTSPAVEQAAPAPKIDTGDTAWMIVATAFVMLMTPGLALFYGGMVRRKNVLGTIMQSFIALGVVSIVWVIYGYSLAFGPDVNHIIGNLDWVGLKGVGLDPNPDYAGTIPHMAFMIFQMMFAVITPALITGAFAERFKFNTYLIFLILWVTFVYAPIAHWVWGVGGWIRNLGVLDFAGGTVVHICSGVSALAAAILIGKRKGYGAEPMPPHNLTMTFLGAALLWFGWFGFNAGSALASGSLATSAFVVTHIATAAAALSWMIAEWAYRNKPTALGVASGAVAGLVAITPASGFVGPISAMIIGFVAGVVCYIAINLKNKIGYDDSLDVVGVHGIGGTWGAIATGLFATTLVNPAGANGVFFGNPSLLGLQAIAVLATWIYAFIATSIILVVLKAIMGLRVSEEEEMIGLDLALHGESGYTFGVGTAITSRIGERKISLGTPKPVIQLTKRIPPKTKHVMPSAPISIRRETVEEEITPPPKLTSPVITKETVERPFSIEVEGIDNSWFTNWWREMCQMDWRVAPQAFRDIYGYVSRFKDKTLSFRKGDPEEFKKRIEELLSKSGMHNFRVRVIG
jgi:Amt family ammonium transporter